MPVVQSSHAVIGETKTLCVNFAGAKDGSDSPTLNTLREKFGGHLYDSAQILAVEVQMTKKSRAAQLGAIRQLQTQIWQTLPDVLIANWASLATEGQQPQVNA